MRKLLLLLEHILLSPAYILAMASPFILSDTTLADWAARRLGLQPPLGSENLLTTGKEGLLEQTAEVVSSFREDTKKRRHQGRVTIRGELWTGAVLEGSAVPQLGEKVRVQAVDGLTLIVESRLKL